MTTIRKVEDIYNEQLLNDENSTIKKVAIAAIRIAQFNIVDYTIEVILNDSTFHIESPDGSFADVKIDPQSIQEMIVAIKKVIYKEI
jgi:hypothetical protein